MSENKNLPKSQKSITDQVLAKVNNFQEAGELILPKDYSPENALKSAYLILTELTDKNGKPAIEVCSRASIAESLLKMVVDGLSPIKKQCYFIVYGSKLNYQKSYQGNIALAKRFAGVQNVRAEAIFEGDIFEYQVDAETGIKKIIKHEQKLENLSNKVKGAYAIVTESDGTKYLEVMNIDQIVKAWNQRQGNGLTKAHENFSDEMAKRTVINRATKGYINSSDDSVLELSERKKPEIENDEVIEDITFSEVTEPVKEVEERGEQLTMEVEQTEETKEEPGF